MNLKEMIEHGAKKTGNQENLAKVIGVSGKFLTEAKGGRRGLPNSACFKLAAILDIHVESVIAASELVTEKDEEKRAFFAPFVLNGISGLATAMTALYLTSASTDANANDTFKVSHEVSEVTNSIGYDNYVPSNMDYSKLSMAKKS